MGRTRRQQMPAKIKLSPSYEQALSSLPASDATAVKAALWMDSDNRAEMQPEVIVQDSKLIERLQAPLAESTDADLITALRAIAETLASLKPEEIVISLWTLAGYSGSEIAAKAGISRSAIHSILQRIKAEQGRVGAAILAAQSRIYRRERWQEDQVRIEKALTNNREQGK